MIGERLPPSKQRPGRRCINILVDTNSQFAPEGSQGLEDMFSNSGLKNIFSELLLLNFREHQYDTYIA